MRERSEVGIVPKHGQWQGLSRAERRFDGDAVCEIRDESGGFGEGHRDPDKCFHPPGPDLCGCSVRTILHALSPALHLAAAQWWGFIPGDQPGDILFDQPGERLRWPSRVAPKRVALWKEQGRVVEAVAP